MIEYFDLTLANAALLRVVGKAVECITVVYHEDMEVYNIHWKVIHTKGRKVTSKMIVLEYAYYLFSVCLLA